MEDCESTFDFTPRTPRERSGDIRLIAVDLDGTLLNDRKQVSPATAEALATLPDRGVHLVLASARPPRSVRHIHEQLQLDTWQINYNGALIWDRVDQKVVFHRPIDGDLTREIILYARDWFDDVQVTCEILDRWHTDDFDPRHTTETGKLFQPDVIAPVDEICAQPVTKLLLLSEPQVIARLHVLIEQEFSERVSVVSTDANLLQIMHLEVGKSRALLKLAEHYDVPMGQVMAIGDAPNDVGMLDISAVAVAMEQADPIVKEHADWVAPSNNADGVLAALQHFEVL